MTDQVPIPAPITPEVLPSGNIPPPMTDIPPPPIHAPVPPPFPDSLPNNNIDNIIKNMTPEEEKIYAIRFKVIEELLATEWVYVNDLKTLVSVFYYPLKRAEQEGKEILPAEEITNIFSNIEAILAFNEQLYRALRNALGRGTAAGASCVGDVFFRLADYLKMYTTYCQNHKNAVEATQRCVKKYHKFAQFLEKQLPETNGLLLKDYLIKPVQRLCKYPLLFTELLKSTPKTHPDYPVIEATIEKVRHVTDSVNKSTAFQENITKLFELKELLVGFPESLEAPGRWYIKEAPLLAGSTNDKNYPELSERHVIVFSDMIMFCKNKRKKFYFKDALKFEGATLRDLKDDQKRKNAFEIVSGKNPGHVFTLSFPSLKEKTSWFQSINGILTNQQQALGVAKGVDSSVQSIPLSSSPNTNRITPPNTPTASTPENTKSVEPKRISQKDLSSLSQTNTPTKKRTYSTGNSGEFKDTLSQLKSTQHRVNVTRASSTSLATPIPNENDEGVSEQDEEESDEVKRKAKALNKEEGKAVTKQKLTRTPSAKSLGKHITKKDGQSLTSSGVFSTGAATTSTSTTVTASTTTTTTTAPSQTAALSVPLTNPLTIPLTGSSDSPTQTQSNPKLLISPSTSSQNLTTNPKSSSTSTIPNVPLNVPIDLTEAMEEDTSALKLRIKELNKKLRKEKRARSDLETKYNALIEAFQALESSFMKVKELIASYEEERQQQQQHNHKSKSSQSPLIQGLNVPPPPLPQKIDNTTSNREFVSPEEAKKDVEEWLKIFGKK